MNGKSEVFMIIVLSCSRKRLTCSWKMWICDMLM